jgi:hypothetical protein
MEQKRKYRAKGEIEVNYPKYSAPAVSLLVFLPAMLIAQRAPDTVVPLKNWATPLYWHANQVEREAAATALTQNAVPQLQLSPTAVSVEALTFVAITPCRLVDTRGSGGGFNGSQPFSGPSITGAGIATFPVQSTTEASTDTTPAPCGTIPAIAEAYSFNLTVIPQTTGGEVGFVTLWPANTTQPVVSTLNDRQGAIVNNAAIVAAGTPSGGVSVYNAGPTTIDVVIDMNGFYASPTDLNSNTAIGAGTLAENTMGNYNTATGANALQANTTGSQNTASGAGALQDNTTGLSNTANGFYALAFNTSGIGNTANGISALQDNTTGGDNTANGGGALGGNTTGSYNTASGFGALAYNTTGSYNTASGIQALYSNTTGNSNVAAGYAALQNTNGSGNIALGFLAATMAPVANGNSIYIGSQGSMNDVGGTIQIGTAATATSFFAAGVSGVTTGLGDAVAVFIDSNGQLGTAVSSERFKEDIQDMGDASSGLLRLRPVTFHYKQAYEDGSKPLDYGLIAEEVARVYPDLAVKGPDGKVQTVQYQKLTPMLLNELQKQAEQIRELEDRLTALETLLSAAPVPVR